MAALSALATTRSLKESDGWRDRVVLDPDPGDPESLRERGRFDERSESAIERDDGLTPKG